MAKAPLIRLENVSKTYELGKIQLNVLKNVSLQINSGSFVVLLGPSGSGKSTLLHIIGLLDTPSKGKIFFEGNDVSKFSEDELAVMRGEKIGFVFQQFNLLPHLSAAGNVSLPMLFRGTSEKARQQRAQDLLESVGLKERITHRPSELSGGEQQRVAIARA
jgi:putative ABC transport system ATP-binding protein